MIYINSSEENIIDDPDQTYSDSSENDNSEASDLSTTTEQNIDELMVAQDDPSVMMEDMDFNNNIALADSQDFSGTQAVTAMSNDSTFENDVLSPDHYELHNSEHHDRIAFAGYSSCYKCSCRGFTGSGQCCDNCGHNYHDHY